MHLLWLLTGWSNYGGEAGNEPHEVPCQSHHGTHLFLCCGMRIVLQKTFLLLKLVDVLGLPILQVLCPVQLQVTIFGVCEPHLFQIGQLPLNMMKMIGLGIQLDDSIFQVVDGKDMVPAQDNVHQKLEGGWCPMEDKQQVLVLPVASCHAKGRIFL